MDVLRVPVIDVTLAQVSVTNGNPVSLQVGVSLAAALYQVGVTSVDVGSLRDPWHFQLAHTIGSAVPALGVMAPCSLDRAQITHAREALKTVRRARIGLAVPTEPEVVKGNRWHSYTYLLERVSDCTSFAARLGLEVDLLVECHQGLDPIFLGRMAQHATNCGAAGITIVEKGNVHTEVFTGLVEKVARAVPEKRVSVRCVNRGSMAATISLAAVENGAKEVASTAAPFGEESVCPSLDSLAAAGLFALNGKQSMQLGICSAALVGSGHDVRLKAAVSTMED